MKCEEALELISGRIDGENTPEEDHLLQAHLDTCAHCREILQAYLEMDNCVAFAAEPSADFTEKVMAAVKKEAAAKKKAITVLPLLATAAALFLVIGLGAIRPAVMEQAPSPMTARTMEADAAAYMQTADAQTIALERKANVVLLQEVLPELDGCGQEMLPDGSVLYELPSAETAQELSEAYGLELFTAPDAEISFGLLVP